MKPLVVVAVTLITFGVIGSLVAVGYLLAEWAARIWPYDGGDDWPDW